ncbi:hypothetical protein HNP37_001545 [Flavobacterium nitrogenifigens]|uniref:HEAT repeat-containing protein n=2 Tax=Flavobacterium TaxID=237 RepID=A0A7W7N7H1_9FLAO|nr:MULTISPECIES: hypothetical protein [Flavobacterium]MBB4801484.1 hypothetical protein [Flavobacterium nitrogenifigens]MBB6386441.1 hypothetical protein [Flavobacterium notoginsengisoli]
MINKISIRCSLFSFLLIAFFQLSCAGKNNTDISEETNLIVKKIEKINVLMGSAVGYGGNRPEQYDNFEELKKTASQEELLQLTKHSNAVVRCYSFWALGNYKNFDLFSLVKDHINDDAPVKTQFGCIISTEKVGDFFINLVNPENENSEIRQLTKKEFSKLETILINQENSLYALNNAIESATPTKALYPKLRALVIKKHNQSALVTLSKYKNPNDIELILTNREKELDDDGESGYFYTYKAIQNFPDPHFFPFLEKRLYETLDNDHFSNEWLEMYAAIAAYKDAKALELLKIPFTKVQHQNIKEYHIKFVYEGILVNPSPLYDDLLWKIWQEEHIITLEGFTYLLQLNSGKTLEFSKKELMPNYQIKNTKSTARFTQGIFTENLEETMLNFLLINDKPFTYKILKEKIATAYVNDFEIYCAKVLELGDKSFAESLFKRLKNEGNPHVYLQIVETLISFKDKAINERILEVRKQNKNMNVDWGSYSLNAILEKNNIK